ncbi:hypothetical protein NP095_06715 [Aeromicrobium duanguangcaii]|uniref:TerD domain-containing protein n=1 Tax=Aeromicrobium duanguangcaii TaxID=2968086 RepID=A0ABY5KIU8_9ACTN|nr:hypothetical protein [Aeromicrobium duanguangcaii]UUI69780.1 hypothetical protein NP095_06715 [Aeromicrobium duanguangcaii]
MAEEQDALVADVEWSLPGGVAALYVMCTDAGGAVSSASDVVFRKTPRLTGDGVVLRHESTPEGRTKAQVQVCFELLDPNVGRLEFVLSAGRSSVLTGLQDLTVAMWNPRDGASVETWTLPSPKLAKRVELGRLERRESGWTVTMNPVPNEFDFNQLFQERYEAPS